MLFRSQVSPAPNRPEINDLLNRYGLSVSDEILMDASHETLSIPTRQTIGGFIQTTVQTPVKLPIQIKVTDQGMNSEVSITNRVSVLLYLWGTGLSVDETKLAENGLEYNVLMESSSRTWTIPFSGAPISPRDIDPKNHEIIGSQPLAVMVSGQFPNAYKDMPPPKWPGQADSIPAASAPAEIVEASGKLVLYGSGQMFSDQIIGAAGNALLMLNSVDALTLGDDLINVRTKMMTQRFISETSAAAKVFWRFFVTILIPLILIAIGITRYMMRRQRRETYQRLLEQTS